jgi:hypothetical protein
VAEVGVEAGIDDRGPSRQVRPMFSTSSSSGCCSAQRSDAIVTTSWNRRWDTPGFGSTYSM